MISTAWNLVCVSSDHKASYCNCCCQHEDPDQLAHHAFRLSSENFFDLLNSLIAAVLNFLIVFLRRLPIQKEVLAVQVNV